jgi:hypothetical protein
MHAFGTNHVSVLVAINLVSLLVVEVQQFSC